VINGATCNGTDHCGCGTTPPVIKVRWQAVFSGHDIVYVASGTTTISVISGDTCNATSQEGMPPRTGDGRQLPHRQPCH
jgi:hypothetical protein